MYEVHRGIRYYHFCRRGPGHVDYNHPPLRGMALCYNRSSRYAIIARCEFTKERGT